MIKTFFRILLSVFMVAIGITHFVQPAPFVRIVPDYLPNPLALVYVSGFFEILGGVGLQIPRVSRWAAWGLVALYVAVFPANINMALHGIPFGELPPSPLLLWGRLPLQFVLIGWAYSYTRKPC